MITAVGTGPGGKPMLLLGLTGENMARLMADEPIVVNPSTLGLDVNLMVVIMGGRSEEVMRDKLTGLGLIGPETTVRNDIPQGRGTAP